MTANFSFKNMIERAGRNHHSWVIDKRGCGTERKLSFSELVGHAKVLAKLLKESGIEPREIIGLKSSNVLEWLVWELAAIMCDVVLQVFPENMPESDGERLAQYRLRVLVSDTAAAERGVLGLIDINSTLCLTKVAPAGLRAPMATISDLHSKSFSSGTAGSLKGLMISRRGTELQVAKFLQAYGISDTDRTILFIPLSHFPQRLVLYACLWAGSSLCLSDLEDVFLSAETFRPTFLSAQASFFSEAIRAKKTAGSEEGHGVLGGKLSFILTAMVSRETLEKYNDIAVPVYETYGITELGMISWNYPGNTRPGTVGKPLDPNDLSFTQDGEILVKREAPLCIGYYNDVDSEHLFEPGYIHTEDLGELDDEGFLVLKGRKQNTVKPKSGDSYQLESIEARIQALLGVEFAAVLYDQADDAVVCYVVPDEKHTSFPEVSLRNSIIDLLDAEIPTADSK